MNAQFLKQIQDSKKSKQMSPRELLNSFGYSRRGKWVCHQIDRELKKHSLETYPYWAEVWIDNKFELKHVEMPASSAKAKSKVTDPVRRISILLEEDNSIKPDYVHPDDPITKATTLMLQKEYSHLIVSNSGLQKHSILGYVSWKTIGLRRIHSGGGERVRDYMDSTMSILPLDTSILEAVESIQKYGFILVSDPLNHNICGMITTKELNASYITLTEKFLLIEQIERQIRILLDNQYTIDEIKQGLNLNESDKQIQSIDLIDGLTFGEYLQLLNYPNYWEKLNISFNKKILIEAIDKVRKLRNEIMHFYPLETEDKQLSELSEISKFLTEITKLSIKDL